MSDQPVRSAEEVLEDHLRESQVGSITDDLARNYADDLVILTSRGIFRGHDGLRQLAELLRAELPNAKFEYKTRLVEGEIAFLEWAARGDRAMIDDGTDSYPDSGRRKMRQRKIEGVAIALPLTGLRPPGYLLAQSFEE